MKNISDKILLLAFIFTAFCSSAEAHINYAYQSIFPMMDSATRNNVIIDLSSKHFKKPSNPFFIRQLAEAYTAEERTDSALAYWKLLNLGQANNDTIFYTEGQLYYAQHNLDSALQFIQNAVALQPENISYLELQAVINYRINKADSALFICDKILSTFPENVNALMLSGIIFRDQKKDMEALDRFDRSVKANPSNTDALIHRADEYVLLKKYNDALRDYSSARADLSENADVLNNMGICYYQSGAYQKAIDFFKKAIALNHQLPQGYYNKGLSFYHLNSIDTASSDIKFASAIWDTCHTDSCRANFMDATYYLGICYKKTGNLAAARSCFELLQKDKYSKDLSSAIRLIDYSLFISRNWYYFVLLFTVTIILLVFIVRLIRR